MSITRSAKPDEIELLVALADRTFRKPNQTSMGTAYAKLFAKENADNLLLIEADEQPVALVGLLKAQLSIAGCTVPVVSMGAVCTDTAYRGRNYADMLVKHSIAKCAEEGAQLLLISGTRGLYARNDCLEVGEVKRFTIRSTDDLEDLAAGAANNEIRPYDGETDKEAVLSLMETETAYYIRTEAEFDSLIRCAAVLSNYAAEQHVWLSFTADGKAAGYAVFGSVVKNGESAVEIVEYAGSDEAVTGIINHITGRFPDQPLHLPVSGTRAVLSEKLAAAGCSFTEIPVPGTIRMIHFPGLWSSLQPYIEQQLGADVLSDLSLVETGNGYRIEYKGDALTVSHRGAATLVFNGPTLTGNSKLKEVLARIFPIPFPYTQNLNYI